MPYFEHDDLKLHYFDDEKDALPFIGLHGLGGDLTQPGGRFHGSGNFRFVSLDFRGHGESRCPNDSALFSMEKYTTDVLALRQNLGIQQFVVGGISLGAAIAQRVAQQEPEAVKALILVRPAWGNIMRPEHLRVFETIAQLLADHDETTALAKWHETSAYADIKTVSPGCAASLDGQFSRPQARASWKLLPALVNDVPVENPMTLRNLTMPTLVVGNDHDPLHPLDLARQLANILPNVTFQEVTSRYEKPEQYQQELQATIQKFLAESL